MQSRCFKANMMCLDSFSAEHGTFKLKEGQDIALIYSQHLVGPDPVTRIQA